MGGLSPGDSERQAEKPVIAGEDTGEVESLDDPHPGNEKSFVRLGFVFLVSRHRQIVDPNPPNPALSQEFGRFGAEMDEFLAEVLPPPQERIEGFEKNPLAGGNPLLSEMGDVDPLARIDGDHAGRPRHRLDRQ